MSRKMSIDMSKYIAKYKFLTYNDVEMEDGKLIITPVVVIPKDQIWYYSKKWQQMENEVDEQIRQGKVYTANSEEELFEGLGLDKL